MAVERKPRKIFSFASGPDKRVTDMNNALYVLIEFVSPKRLATLERVPTAAELVAAVDLYMKCEDHQRSLAAARALRAAAETWTGDEIPVSVHAAAKALFSIFTPEPPGGWDEDDGYYHGPEQPGDREALDRAGAQMARAAQTVMEGLNLAGILAQPGQQAVPLSREHVLEHLDALLEVLPSLGGVTANHLDAANELRTACAGWEEGRATPAAVQQAARRLLALMGAGESGADT